MVSDGSKRQDGTDQGDWAAWLGAFAPQSDPLGVQALLIRSADALGQARTPADALRALGDAIAAEREHRQRQGDQLDTLLEQWSTTLQAIAPAFPDHRPADTPSLGPYPRRQDQLRALGEQIDTYQAALADHLDGVTDLAEACLNDLRAELNAADAPPPDPAALAERWAAIAEPRYEAWLARPDTERRIAALVNAWSALQTTLRALADDLLEGLGLPSARGMDDLAAELQRQRRRQRRETAALRAEIAALRAQLHGDGESAR
ncbi:hypothetical protein A6K26_002620 [Gammaproteobacteria bacterium 2W06]|nr:hypothetical protein A6K26_002620 [Gammaproteobacteria bacterium 2W06]